MVDFSGEDFENVLIGNRYRLISLLGEGAMGNVFLAEDEYLKRQVAIKVLRDEWGARADVIKRLENECRLMAHLGQHPNIVTLLDRLVDDGKTMLIMEYASGETLAKILNRTAQIKEASGSTKKAENRDESLPLVLTPALINEIAAQCLKALDYAHDKGVLHLDIKPSNIMIQRDHMGHITAKLMDFGIGQTRVDTILESAVTALTFTEAVGLGTPAYMAPEQIDPERFGTPGPAADIYSFGVTFFEMSTLQLPFTGAYTEVLHAHTNSRPPNPRDINPDVPVPLARAILTALRKSPGNRYHSAGEMLLELQGMRQAEARTGEYSYDDDASDKGKARQWKISLNLSKRTVLMALILVFCAAFWYFEWELPRPGKGILTFMQEGGLTLSQARDAADAARETARKLQAHVHAPEEWKKGEAYYEEASNKKGAESVRLFVQAQESYEVSTELAAKIQKEASAGKTPEEQQVETAQADTPESSQEDKAEREEFAEASPEDKPETSPPPKRLERRETRKKTSILLGAGVELELVWISPGVFTMGSAEVVGLRTGGRSRRGSPQTKQELTQEVWILQGFWMGQFEVTQEQWQQVMGNNPSKFRGDPRRPVDSVSWHDAQAFVNRLNQMTPGGGFRLPTEAEWEYAARAGTKTAFYGGFTPEKLGEYAWHSGNSGGQTQPVGSKLSNAWELHDMLGNLWEWVQDWYSPNYHTERPHINPTGPATGMYKILRGGAWSYHQNQSSLTSRTNSEPGQRQDVYGFRVVRTGVAPRN